MAIEIRPPILPASIERGLSLVERDFRAYGRWAVDQDWSLVRCAQVLYRNKGRLLWIIGSCVAIAILATLLQSPMYQSRASIQIQGVNDNFLDLRDVYPTSAPAADNAVYLQTQAEMLRQDGLIEQAINKLHLEERPESRSSSSFWDRLIGRRGPSAVEQIKRHIQIVPVRGTSIVQIISEARDPKVAADLANTIAQGFIDQGIEARQRSAMQTYLSLSVERDALQNRLVESENEIGRYGKGDGGTRSGVALKRELDGNRKLYESISKRADDAQLASTMRQSNVRLAGTAQPAAYPKKPNGLFNLLAGAFGGLALGIGFVMLREQTNCVLRAPEEATTYLGVPELGAIPKMRNGGLGFLWRAPEGSTTPTVERISLEQSTSEVAESFRGVAASILAATQNGDQSRILLVTSPCATEGKTTVLTNLGIALTEVGKKILLIDGDLRSPRLHKIFDQANSWGLSSLLQEKDATEDLPLDALVKRTMVPNLYLLPSGTPSENIFALLSCGRVTRLLQRFREEFDFVLVDTPPCLDFADARIMGRDTDSLLLVVWADKTPLRKAQAAVQRFLSDGIPVMGVIFNFLDSETDVYSYAHRRGHLG